jgi:hypothetical protein
MLAKHISKHYLKKSDENGLQIIHFTLTFIIIHYVRAVQLAVHRLHAARQLVLYRWQEFPSISQNVIAFLMFIQAASHVKKKKRYKTCLLNNLCNFLITVSLKTI